MAAWAYDRVTPLELVMLRSESGGRANLVLADLALVAGFTSEERRSYDVSFHDHRGEILAKSRRLRAHRSLVAVILPQALREHPYVVVRVRGRSGAGALPRSFEIHLLSSDDGYRVIGMRH